MEFKVKAHSDILQELEVVWSLFHLCVYLKQ